MNNPFENELAVEYALIVGLLGEPTVQPARANRGWAFGYGPPSKSRWCRVAIAHCDDDIWLIGTAPNIDEEHHNFFSLFVRMHDARWRHENEFPPLPDKND